MPIVFQLRLKHLAAAALALAAWSASSQPARAEWPEHTITAIVPFTTGGGSDIMARLFSAFMAPKLGQSIVIENKPGAGGNLGIQIVGQSKPDGYTILFCSTAMTFNPSLYKNLSWNPNDLYATAQMGVANQLIVVNIEKFPKGDLKDFVDYMKKNPGKVNFASQDSGFNANLFKSVTGTNFEVINYPGGGETAASVVKGETDVASQNYSSSTAGLSAGKIRTLAYTGVKRLAQLPEIPTTAEMGYGAYNPTAYFGVWVRAGTPKPIIDRINAVVNGLQSDPDLKAKMGALGFLSDPLMPEQFDKFYHDDIARWQKVANDAHIPTLD